MEARATGEGLSPINSNAVVNLAYTNLSDAGYAINSQDNDIKSLSIANSTLTNVGGGIYVRRPNAFSVTASTFDVLSNYAIRIRYSNSNSSNAIVISDNVFNGDQDFNSVYLFPG